MATLKEVQIFLRIDKLLAIQFLKSFNYFCVLQLSIRSDLATPWSGLTHNSNVAAIYNKTNDAHLFQQATLTHWSNTHTHIVYILYHMIYTYYICIPVYSTCKILALYFDFKLGDFNCRPSSTCLGRVASFLVLLLIVSYRVCICICICMYVHIYTLMYFALRVVVALFFK